MKKGNKLKQKLILNVKAPISAEKEEYQNKLE